MLRRIRRLSAGVATGAVIAAMATSASALTINLIDTGGVTGSPAEAGFRAAAHFWETVLTNDAVLNINVGYSDLGPNVLGGTFSNLLQYVPIDAYYGALAATASSALDAQAVLNLSPTNGSGGVSVLVPGYTSPGFGIDASTSRLAPDDAINSTIALSTANAKALGANLGPNVIDADIQFSNTFAFDFDPTNGIKTETYDFIAVATHEIGHALGFLSAADDFDYFSGYTGSVDDSWWGYGLDMFRYSANGGSPSLDWRPNSSSYFSIDGGQSALMNGYFSTGTNFGNGWQASHWLPPQSAPFCSGFLGVMNPYVCNGRVGQVTSLDLALFDAIGWNINYDVLANPGATFDTASMRQAVPEPATWAMLIAGFGFAGAVLRRRRRDALAI